VGGRKGKEGKRKKREAMAWIIHGRIRRYFGARQTLASVNCGRSGEEKKEGCRQH